MGISLVALVLSLIIGTLSALMSLSSRAALRNIAGGYISVIRSTPLLIQIYLIYFALPALPLLDRRLTELEGGIIALGLNAGAFMSEIIRAGIVSIERGQIEGAMSVGMTYYTAHALRNPAPGNRPGYAAASGANGCAYQG